jgi:hypothetical protein
MILCRKGKAEAALHHLREIMGKLKLTANEEKTHICKVPEGEFDFLGYTFGRMYSAKTGVVDESVTTQSRSPMDMMVHGEFPTCSRRIAAVLEQGVGAVEHLTNPGIKAAPARDRCHCRRPLFVKLRQLIDPCPGS